MMAANDPIDWELDNEGDLVVPLRYVTGLDAVAQGIRVRVRLIKGEWFRDPDLGVDWYGKILGQKYDASRVQSEIRRAISATPGVSEILSISTGFSSENRTLSVSWRVRVDLDGLTGEVVDSIEVAS